MKSGFTTIILAIFTLLFNTPLTAQSNSGSDIFANSLIIIAAILIIGVILLVGDSMLKIEARKSGVKNTEEFSIIPSFSSWFKEKKPEYAANDNYVHLKKGHDILLEGDPDERLYATGGSKTFSVMPPNFIGMSPIPKVEVETGDEVKAGDVLFYDKKSPQIKYVSPVSGEIVSVNRGAKRAIASVVILADKEMKYRDLNPPVLGECSREELVNFLLESGGWTMLRQRPFDTLPTPTDTPKSIFVSTFDSAPLAPDLDFVVEGREANFQKGLDVLNMLTEGFVHLGLDAREGELPPSAAFTLAEGVKKTWFSGAHPSGNVGIQIHHIDPINSGEKVWYLGVQEVITLGALFMEKKFNAERLVAVGGAELSEAAYYRTYIGANVADLVENKLTNDHVRFVSGDVLSGKAKAKEEYLNYFDDQLTVIEEGDSYELFGWLLPISLRPSLSRTFPNFLLGKDLTFHANTNTHGEERAFVMTGQYEEVLPMDIYPQHLMKAIMMQDFERMEGLGIFELSEEDIALCEFSCTSKQPLQHILREGLDLMREQL